MNIQVSKDDGPPSNTSTPCVHSLVPNLQHAGLKQPTSDLASHDFDFTEEVDPVKVPSKHGMWYWAKMQKIFGRNDPDAPSRRSSVPDVISQRDGSQQPSVRPVGIGLPRVQTFKRQNSEKRDRLVPVHPCRAERRAVSCSRRLDKAYGFGQMPTTTPSRPSNIAMFDSPPTADYHEGPIRNKDLLAMEGPSSTRDPETAIEHVQKLKELSDDHEIRIIIPGYMEERRATVGWKDLLNDPDTDESLKVNREIPVVSHQIYSDLTMGMPIASPRAAKGSPSRRGRGDRKNREYWKLMADDIDHFNPFERDCLFGNDDGGLNVPAYSYMDSSYGVPRCMSMKYLKQLGLESKLSTDFDDPGLSSICMGGQTANVTGIVRDISFRIKGWSTTFKGDFYISEILDGVYDILFGWKFMCNEAAEILEKAHTVYREAKAFVGRGASAFSAKIEKAASKVQTRVSALARGVSSPPPPYSLVNVLEGDFLVTPRLI